MDENIMTPVASLKLASDSIRVESNFGTLTFLNASITIAASVGAINAANAKDTMYGKPAKYTSRNPPTNVARRTPTVDNKSADIRTCLNSSCLTFIIASKINGGTMKTRINLGSTLNWDMLPKSSPVK